MNNKHVKHKIFLTAILVLLVLLCCSCSSEDNQSYSDPEPKDGEIKIYCVNNAEDSLQWENIDLSGNTLNEKMYEIGGRLKKAPQNTAYKSAVPENVDILAYNIGADNQLIITFSNEYNLMESITEALCRASIVLTYCQLDEIDYVEFSIEGQPLKVNDIPVGLMSENDFLDKSDDGSGYDQSVIVTIFLTDEKGKMLQESALKVMIDGTKTLEETALLELIAGPLESQKNLRPVLDKDVKINKVRSYDGICYVDFNEKFMSKLSGISDEVAVYSVVNTLCEIPGITKVRITVNGSEKKALGKVSIDEFLSYRPDLITIEKAGD